MTTTAQSPFTRQFQTAGARFPASYLGPANHLSWTLLALFIPAWYLFMALIVSHKPLHFKLFSSGIILRADGRGYL